MYYHNESVKLAIEWYKKAAEQNNSEAQYKLACIYIDQNDIDNAMRWYLSSAELGNFDAQVDVVRLYLDSGNEKKHDL